MLDPPTFWIIAWLLLSEPVSGSANSGSTPPPDLDRVYREKHLEPRTVHYLEHVGPYWRIGPLLAQVADSVHRRGLAGEAFVRMIDDSRSMPPTRMRLWIGYVAPAELPAEPPFQIGRLDAETVVSVAAEGETHPPAAWHRLLDAWCNVRGRTHRGQLTEVYRLRVNQQGQEAVLELVEVQLPIDGTPATDGPRPPPEPPAEALPNPATEGARVEPAPLPMVVPKADAPPSIKELLEAGDPERAADLLFANALAVDSATAQWLAGIVARVSAAARGLERVDPKDSGPLRLVATSLERRCEEALGKRCAEIAKQAPPVVAPHGDVQAAVRRKLATEFDRLLARVAQRTIDSARAFQEISSLLEQVYEHVRKSEGPVQNSSAP
jgi:hypothetical protein